MFAARGDEAQAEQASAALNAIEDTLAARLAEIDTALAFQRAEAALDAASRAFPASSDVHFYQYAYRDALARKDEALRQLGRDADRIDVLRLRAFFEPIAVRRAALWLDRAEAALRAHEHGAAEDSLRTAVVLLMHEPVSDATRAAARRAGAPACATAGLEGRKPAWCTPMRGSASRSGTAWRRPAARPFSVSRCSRAWN